MPDIDPRLIILNDHDTVAVVRCAIDAGEKVQIGDAVVTLMQAVTMGHKLARASMQAGDKVLKYGVPIGSATMAIAIGDHVHLHNMKSDYTPTYALTETGDIA